MTGSCQGLKSKMEYNAEVFYLMHIWAQRLS